MPSCILEDNINYVVKKSRQKDISKEETISLYDDIVEKLNDYLMYHKFGLREGEIGVLRRGDLKETKYAGFNFILESGETTYVDPFDPDVIRYAIQEKYILNIIDKNSELRKEFDEKLEEFEKSTKDKELIEIIENAKKIIKEKDEENGIYTYSEIEENVIDVLAKELGFKGILYWEWGDISKPSTCLVFDLSIIREVPKYSTIYRTV